MENAVCEAGKMAAPHAVDQVTYWNANAIMLRKSAITFGFLSTPSGNTLWVTKTCGSVWNAMLPSTLYLRMLDESLFLIVPITLNVACVPAKIAVDVSAF